MSEREKYAEIIIRDERDKIASEKTVVFEPDKIERLYKFYDGAVVKYEWQAPPANKTSDYESFNHRFSLIKLPAPNPFQLQTGIIKIIRYPKL